MTASPFAPGPPRSEPGRPVAAASVSARVHDLVFEPSASLYVESVFAEACNIVAADGQRYALVGASIGDGPLNVVLNRTGPLAVIEVGDAVDCDGARLRIGRGWRVDLRNAQTWNPVPRFQRLARWPAVARQNLAWLIRHAAPRSALAGTADPPAAAVSGAFGGRSWNAAVLARAGETIQALLAAHSQGDAYRLRTAARRLAGLGPGLTPAGDDWLCGWLVGLRVRQLIAADELSGSLAVDAVKKAVLQGADGQTTELSHAFLSAAADGAVPQAWHLFIDALSNADPAPLRNAANQVVRAGATSGADMLAGFLAAHSTPG